MMNAPSPSHSPTSSLTGKMSEKSAMKSDEGTNNKDNGVSGGILSVLRGQQQQHVSPTSLVLLPPESNLPMFPSLRGPHQASSNASAAKKRPIDVVANHTAAMPPPPPLSSMNIQDIAKEALRLTRETLLSQEQQHAPASAATTNTEATIGKWNNRNSLCRSHLSAFHVACCLSLFWTSHQHHSHLLSSLSTSIQAERRQDNRSLVG